MRFIAFAFCLALLLRCVCAAEFRVDRDVFVVKPSILEKTPKWDPSTEDIPLNAAQAMKLGCAYHDSREIGLFKWELSGCTLVREQNRRWYWVVQFRGKFAPSEMMPKMRNPPIAISYGGPKTLYHRVPVLMNGKLAPRNAGTIDPDRLPAAVRKTEDVGEPRDEPKTRSRHF
ncbi:hypothetical protein [Stieleria maiorica]|uniref:hypothetical protein n=1 Tax=Stieleria maiorica TaxID=2795974 RepID=UPI0011C92E98|nr:hypothetical protein [Stieleria maiorica]